MPDSFSYDVLIIGGGAAGLGLALSLADQAKVALISKGTLFAGSSQHAQGGIAAVLNTDESKLAQHIQDTMQTSAGLAHLKAVEFTVRNAKKAIHWLVDHGVDFTLQPAGDAYHLTQEGGHSERRIVHAKDKTGGVIVKTLVEQAQQHPNITCYSHHTAVDLIMDQADCVGATILNNKTQAVEYFFANATVLATGGASKVYLHSSNPDSTSGDGLAMAWRAGCAISNLEFNQFHPTTLYHPEAHHYLLTEAMRGEGATLQLPNGERFMLRYHPQAELAPRDIVARAIHHEMQQHRLKHIYLDISHKLPEEIRRLFPTIFAHCLKFNIDITKERIPVVPAAHYTCGGVVTDLQGKTDIHRLFAIGEVACTGLHGANRMASNSLLECLVFAMSASQAIKALLSCHTDKISAQNIIDIKNNKTKDKIDLIQIKQSLQKLRECMWENVGIVRSNKNLVSAQKVISELKKRFLYSFKDIRVTKEYLEFYNMLTVSDLIVRCAQQRKESRGAHYNIDYPKTNSKVVDTVLKSEKIFSPA